MHLNYVHKSRSQFYNQNYTKPLMFKRLIEETSLYQRPVSPIRTQASPFKTRKYELPITPNNRAGKSPIRTDPRDNGGKYYMESNFPKVKTATPYKDKSPMRDYEHLGTNFYKKMTYRQDNSRSPIRARPFNEVFKVEPKQNYYRGDDSSRNYMTETEKENKKHNFQLFTKLIGEIKLNGEFSHNNSQAQQAPVKPQSAKPQLSQFSELLRQRSPQSKKPPLMRTVSAGYQIPKEESMLISNGAQSNRDNLSVGVGTCPTVSQASQFSKEAPKEAPKESNIVNFSLGMQSKVKMVESVKPPAPPPLIVPGPNINLSGESITLMDRVNESQEVDFSNMEDRLNMEPCL